jgi:hypothetical protein
MKRLQRRGRALKRLRVPLRRLCVCHSPLLHVVLRIVAFWWLWVVMRVCTGGCHRGGDSPDVVLVIG